MANIHRRIERQIKGAVKKLKRGEIPVPPPPRTVSAEEEKQFLKEMQDYRRFLRRSLDSLSADASRAGHKKRLRLDEQLSSLNELLNNAEVNDSDT